VTDTVERMQHDASPPLIYIIYEGFVPDRGHPCESSNSFRCMSIRYCISSLSRLFSIGVSCFCWLRPKCHSCSPVKCVINSTEESVLINSQSRYGHLNFLINCLLMSTNGCAYCRISVTGATVEFTHRVMEFVIRVIDCSNTICIGRTIRDSAFGDHSSSRRGTLLRGTM